MLPIQNRPHRTSIPATGLGSILVASPQLAFVADRGVVVEVAVAVGMGEGSLSDRDRRPWADATGGAGPDGSSAGDARAARSSAGDAGSSAAADERRAGAIR